MAFDISVGPAQLTINAGECVLITEPDGQVRQPSERGLFYRDTRLVSAWSVTVDGQPWTLLSSAVTEHFAAQAVMVNPALFRDSGEVPKGTISLSISRVIGEGGLRETLAVRNHHLEPVRLSLAIRVAGDFADIFDVKSHRLVSRGDTETHWSAHDACLHTTHSNGSFRRGLSLGPAAGAPHPVLRDGALCFVVEMASQGAWTADLDYRVIDGDTMAPKRTSSFYDRLECEQAAALARWRSQAIRLVTPYVPLQQLYDQSLDDLAALRLPLECDQTPAFLPAAGIPWFAALFGRDSIITALQTLPVYPDFARGALAMLARYQADGTDDSRDMQPGKIPHELRHGELAQLGLVPYTPYYGTADATPLYLVLLYRAWRFTGDRSLIETHLDTAERCLCWIDEHGDLDGDGFQEYQRRSPKGAENQGWKDSGNAILYENGSDVPAPKALCELQGYVYDAWGRMAAIYDALGRPQDAARLRAKAQEMFDRFNDAFWDDATQAYALCLDPGKKRVMSNASNAGHLLWSGIVPEDRARLVADRLMADDMWSGWGVRTLSASHAAYNPHDYQLGAVWPHDNGLIAIGLKRYGYHEQAARIARGLIEAGSRFMLNRMPEVFAGTSRADSPFPIQYLGANTPQAWAAGSIFSLLRSLLGIEIDAAAATIYADPVLPDWLGELRLERVHVGDRTVDLRVWRDGEDSQVEILGDSSGVVLVRRAFRDASHHLQRPWPGSSAQVDK